MIGSVIKCTHFCLPVLTERTEERKSEYQENI